MPPWICAVSVLGLTARPGSTAQIDALHRGPVAARRELDDLGDVGLETAATADVAVVGDAANHAGRRGLLPFRGVGHGIEHAQRQRIGGEQVPPIGVLVDPGAVGELGDEALPEEHRGRRADGAHEIDRHRQRRIDGLDQEVRQPIALIIDAVDHALVPRALGRLVEPALARGAEQRLADDAGMDRQRIALRHRARRGSGRRH